ncbi:hypothetical protein BZL54_01530 [Burkholderia ubonensis subsp. mesacidophila]|uniref:Uncharacterized protein n=2 Tax=Burkholderia ubonensis TaxID=101571 RepID=A0A2A4FNS0_9BURK|nr:hypothetical protein BZL54_01530 [Burkholderia ubonensis subsp. mesacidophila]
MTIMEKTLYEAEVIVGKERISLRLISFNVATVLERKLVHADGTSFVHSLLLDTEAVLFDYQTADPYFMQLERHYSFVREKIRQVAIR